MNGGISAKLFVSIASGCLPDPHSLVLNNSHFHRDQGMEVDSPPVRTMLTIQADETRQ